MKTLIGYEIRKIVKKKSFFLVTALFLVMQIVLALSCVIGKTYVNGEVLETAAEGVRTDRENGLKFSGTTIDQTLLDAMQDAYEQIEITEDRSYLLTETYQKEVRPYDDLLAMMQNMTEFSRMQLLTTTESGLYDAMEQLKNSYWNAYNLSEEEQNYWEEKGTVWETPVVYEYSSYAYMSLISMNGQYMTFMMLIFLIAICFCNVFMQEANQRTDQMILCTRHGRGRLYAAKMLAGSIVSVIVTILFSTVSFLGRIAACGAEGADVALQKVFCSWYPYPLTLGETYLIMTGILLIASVMTAVITMILAWILKNGVVTMALMSGSVFVARLIYIPDRFRFFSKLWNLIPINLLKIDQGFVDMRLFSVFGQKFTGWQIAPVLYIAIMVVMILIGKRAYCSTQIKGR